MIARLMGDGQYEIDEALCTRLNELDDKAVAALEANDEEQLDGYLDQMAELVRSEGNPTRGRRPVCLGDRDPAERLDARGDATALLGPRPRPGFARAAAVAAT